VKKISVLAAMFSALFVTSNISAQSVPAEADKLKVERYYIGIGAQLNKEENGNFTVSRILADSPADLAGLKEGDEIFDINQLLAQAYWFGAKQEGRGETLNLLDWLKDKEGQEVELKVKRSDEELDIKVYPAQIDRLSWVTMDIWLRSYVSQDDPPSVGLAFNAKVSEDKNGKFVYVYKLTNLGKGDVFVNSEILQIAGGDIRGIVRLKKGKTIEVQLVSDDFPVEYGGATTVFQSPKSAKWVLDLQKKEYGFSAPKDYWFGVMSTRMRGFVPANQLQKFFERAKR